MAKSPKISIARRMGSRTGRNPMGSRMGRNPMGDMMEDMLDGMAGMPETEDEELETYKSDEEEDREDEDESGDGEDSKERERLRAVHEDALEEFHTIVSALKDEREQCLQDRRFAYIAGAQWEQDGDQFKNKPKLEVNKIGQALDQIAADFRDNRIDVSFISKDGALDEDLADTCAALHRSDEQDSSAEEAYSNAFEEMSAGGYGAWRLRTRKEDPDSDEEDEPQRIQIEPIYDADRFVFFDLNARKHDKSDARVCYITTPLTRREYERRYPDDDPASWPDTVHNTEFDWLTPDVVYVAERFSVERVPDVKCVYTPPTAPDAMGGSPEGGEETYWKSELDADPTIAEELLAMGYQKTTEKKAKRRRIRKYIMNGMRILKDCGYIVGTELPVVPVYGHRFFIDNIERCHGHVRRSKDPQRIKNMLLSKLAEISALSSIKKPMFLPEQIVPHKQVWADDNIANNPWLPVDPATNADGQKQPMGPLAWTESAEVPPATAALHQQIDIDMKEILGNPNEGEKVISHTSSRTVQAVQRRVDKKSSLYVSNMGKAIRRSGQIWLGMAPEIYNQKGRRMKGIGPQGELRRIELMKPAIKDTEVATGGLVISNNLRRAKFDVAVEVGPSSESRREASVEAGTNMLAVTEDPETKLVITLFILTNMQGEGIEHIRKWARRALVQKGVIPPTPEEAQAMAEAAKQNSQPTPIDQLALAQAEEALAKAQKIVADRILTMAQVDKTQAETVKTLVDANLQPNRELVDAAKSLHDMAVQTAQAMQPPSGGLSRSGMQPAPGDGSKPSGSS